MSISASLVMQLREITGAGMMECKKVLVATNGDIELAVVELRKQGQAQADKKASRVAADGVVVIDRSSSMHDAVMVEVNSETDFVARDENLTRFADQVAQTALNSNVADVDALANEMMSGTDQTVEKSRQEVISKVGENIQLRRLVRLHSEGVIGSYRHGTKIGVLVAVKNGDEALAKDLAMHIAASRPSVINREEVSADAIAREREIFEAQARESGKPQDIIVKMTEGRINKFIDEVALVGQPFVKDPNKKVGQLLKERQAEVEAFIRFEVGEGIEKKVDNFVEEVMAQVRDQ